MSILLVKRVYELDLNCTYERHVLARLADRTNDRRGVSWPSVASIARDVVCSCRKVQSAIKALEKRGLLSVERNAGPKGCNLYRLTLPPALNAPLNAVHPSTQDIHLPQDRTQTPARDAHEPKKNPKKPLPRKGQKTKDDFSVKAIIDGKRYLLAGVSAHKARTLVSEGRVTVEQCEAVGLI